MVYEPAEDSFLIQTEVKRLAKGKVLEIGIGSGILSRTAAESRKVDSVLGVDIKKAAVEHCKSTIKSRNVRFLQSDLFAKVPKQKFNTIIFNPPYLPEQDGENHEVSLDVAGGKHGYEIIERFLGAANDYLASGGFILLLFSTITGKMKVDELITDFMMDFEQLNKANLAFEQLFVYRIKKSSFRKKLEKRRISGIHKFSQGHRGKIFRGVMGKKKIAIKVQRGDIGVSGTVDIEAKMLKRLNKQGIGPKVLFSGKDYFAYSFVEGKFILDFLDDKNTKRSDAIAVFKSILEQMFLLDSLGLNKEEMHHPIKHIVVQKGNLPVLLDFERCREKKHTHNVTQFCQFLISGRLLVHLQRYDIKISMLKMLKLAKEYSKSMTRENFDVILDMVK